MLLEIIFDVSTLLVEFVFVFDGCYDNPFSSPWLEMFGLLQQDYASGTERVGWLTSAIESEFISR